MDRRALWLVPVRDGWLDNGVGAYLTASEYLGPFELAHGHDFDPSAWADVLLRLHPYGDARFPSSSPQWRAALG